MLSNNPIFFLSYIHNRVFSATSQRVINMSSNIVRLVANVWTKSSLRIRPSAANKLHKLPTSSIGMEPKRKTNRLNDPFCAVQVARGGRIHPVSSHANMPDDRAAVIETMCGYLRGADCSRKLVVTVRVLGRVRGPVIDLRTTRGPVIITPVPSGRGHA